MRSEQSFATGDPGGVHEGEEMPPEGPQTCVLPISLRIYLAAFPLAVVAPGHVLEVAGVSGQVPAAAEIESAVGTAVMVSHQ